ncbi:energy transducer TonB [Sphingomonas glaciei]|uniref:Energy transducer TonB n=1 Tax=Sphingomonas glaciei TaxID=2938948 RepID=A0ABY5N0L9_9SPHN|nr:energy transducer TonB [Sphingomonas glaciei]UUR09274.1 energy transducer TonB [Sphingomonas glaciei]
MRRQLATPADRVRSVGLAALIHLGIGYALLTGLGVTPVPAKLAEPLTLLDITEPPEPEPPAVPMLPEPAPKPTERAADPEGAAAPPALKNTPTPVVAPPPVVRLPVPPPLPAAPIAGIGTAPNPGAAPFDGPGTGRGGEGEGLGAGRSGNGTGGGGSGGVAQEPEYLSGSIEWRDVPPAVQAQGPRGIVRFRLLVGTDGRVRDCRVTRSSGYPGLDAATCTAAIRRLRFAPARDTAGRPVEAWSPGSNEWNRRPGADRWVDPVEVRD